MRPSWDAAGAQFVQSVEAYETMKLRCLNGTHSALAYLGSLAGFQAVSEVAADKDFGQFLTRLWIEEIIPGLPKDENLDPHSYIAVLRHRYANRGICYRLQQSAMDGSQKLSQRLFAPLPII